MYLARYFLGLINNHDVVSQSLGECYY
jgi:hypothetical protein